MSRDAIFCVSTDFGVRKLAFAFFVGTEPCSVPTCFCCSGAIYRTPHITIIFLTLILIIQKFD